jgi:iron(III) transport system permease protein
MYYSSGTGSRRPPSTIKLGRWRWPALIFCATVAGLALVMPLGVIAYWLVRGISTGEQLMFVWQLALNSVYVSGLAALVAVIAALPVAILAVRFPGLLSNLLERSTYIGFGLPGIVVALSLVFFGAKYATPLYQSMAMLIFAYVVLFIPQAVGTTRSSLLQMNPRLEEAASSLGSNLWQTLRRVTAPLVRPGLLTGAALVFLTTMKELPATLLLAPTGFNTLATRIWSATDDAFFARAAAPALLLVAVSALSMVIILSQEQRSEGRGKQ